MKKVFAALAACLSLTALSGCGAKMPEGYDTVKTAKTKYNSLDSAHTTMTDLDTGELIMDFSFYINNSDEMILSYYGKDGNDEMYAYSDGAQYFYKEPGKDMWSVINSSAEEYLYNIYNRENRYPYADGGIFFLDGSSVVEATVETEADGSTVVCYVYDAEKLNQSTQGILEDVSSFSSLETIFEINADGYITSFTEIGTVTDTSGVTRDVNMCISVDSMNDVYEIPYPVDKLDKTSSD